MIHRHLDYDQHDPVLERGRAALDDVLDGGDLDEWAPLAEAVAADPHGPLASRILDLCRAHPMYGTSELWPRWIARLRTSPGSGPAVGLSLGELRVRRGLRQVDVAARLGASQPDISKTEARSDIRLSTLAAYVAATGGRLVCRAVYADDDVELGLGR